MRRSAENQPTASEKKDDEETELKALEPLTTVDFGVYLWQLVAVGEDDGVILLGLLQRIGDGKICAGMSQNHALECNEALCRGTYDDQAIKRKERLR